MQLKKEMSIFTYQLGYDGTQDSSESRTQGSAMSYGWEALETTHPPGFEILLLRRSLRRLTDTSRRLECAAGVVETAISARS